MVYRTAGWHAIFENAGVAAAITVAIANVFDTPASSGNLPDPYRLIQIISGLKIHPQLRRCSQCISEVKNGCRGDDPRIATIYEKNYDAVNAAWLE